MEQMEQLTGIVSNFFNLPQVHAIIGLIIADLLFGVFSALRRKEFDYRKVFDFYVTNFLPYLGGYGAAHILAALVKPELLDGFGAILAWLLDNSWGVVVARLMASIIANLQEMGYEIPIGGGVDDA